MQGFNEFWTLYQDSFPACERRDKESQQLLFKNPRYKLVPYYKDGNMVAFMALWNLDNFLFIEHFAVRQDLRGNGYGSKIIDDIEKKYGRKIVLEVEPPENTIAQRRINFYKRLGFCLNDYYYVQPPYNKEGDAIRLYLMSYPIPIAPQKASVVIGSIYKHVYNGEKPTFYKPKS